MTKFNILNAEIGAPDGGIRQLTIENVSVDTITFEDGRTAEKVFLKCKTITGDREFNISEAWNKTRKNKKVQGLWVQLDDDKKLIANSTLAKLLAYHEVNTISDLIEKKVTGYPDPNGYVVLTTIPMELDENIKTILD